MGLKPFVTKNTNNFRVNYKFSALEGVPLLKIRKPCSNFTGNIMYHQSLDCIIPMVGTKSMIYTKK